MRNIYTSIDMGSDSIKIVVAEMYNDNLYVLASASRKSKGIKKGLVTDRELARESLEKAISEIEKQIGFRIDKAIVTVPSNDRKLKIVSGSYVLKGEEAAVTGRDINKSLENAVVGSYDDEHELVCVLPIVFSVDDRKNVFDPKGLVGKKLGVKAVTGVVPKTVLYPFLQVFADCGIEVVDIAFGSIGDYSIGANRDNDKVIGAVINIGEETINISIFNKKILIKNEIINLGSKNIDNDIMYIFGVDRKTARFLKEKFAACSTRYSDKFDTIEVKINDNEKTTIDQEYITKVIEARVIELLKLSEKQINNLTNRKISYIIITGGITSIPGFNYVVESVLGLSAFVIPESTLGVRNNKYSSAAGLIKYYDHKMKLRDKNYSMFTDEQIDILMSYTGNNKVAE